MSIKFLSSDISSKEPVELDLTDQQDDEQKKYQVLLHKSLNQILDAENIIILAGSGTSLTFNISIGDKVAPSMTDLWHACYTMDEKIFDDIKSYTKYDDFAEKWKDKNGNECIAHDIELLLSR